MKNPSLTAKELEGGLLIVDEMSMVDTWLANTLLKAIPTNMQVILLVIRISYRLSVQVKSYMTYCKLTKFPNVS